ncbi:RND family efflux transporter protein (plasmid) [Rhizobium etli 8C-3]|uniref:RND family efflux transporter protein n=2 Tax=Rhizobium TaxID=379 RepID=A0A1L5PFF0_RHIET|nr:MULTISPECIES: secretion protein HlyD [Rhizobium]APO78904.1 RND family efflux transporter protein [Rhizobium etli 8C-3]TCU28878.1 HlyD family secretion protein [Rhizobium azibense]
MNKLVPAAILLASAAAAGWWFDAPSRLGWGPQDPGEFTLYGNVDIRQVSLAFRVSGRLEEARVDEGDTVKRGAILARLDNEPYDYAVRSAQANVAALRATLDKLKAGPRPAEIAQASASYNESLADLKNANLAYDRARQLRPQGTVSQAGLDQATAARAMAAARAESANQALVLLREGSRAEDIAAAAAQLKAAEATLATAQTSLDDTELRAPNDGIILSRIKEPGAIVSSADAVYVLSLTEPVWVRSYVAEAELGRIYPGMKVKVTSDTKPDQAYEGRIGFISPVAEFTPKSVETPELRTDLVYRLRVVIERPGLDLRQGMPVTLRLPSLQAATR